MKKYKVLCLWDIEVAPHCLDNLRQVADVDVLPPDEHAHDEIEKYDAYLAALKVRFDRATAQRAKNMKIVATPSTGLDHLDIDAIEEAGIKWVCIKTEYGLLDSITATAELAFALMLSSARHIPQAHGAAMQGWWARDRFRGHQLSGKTFGILGVGRLGKMVAEYASGFRMNVIGHDNNPRFKLDNVRYVSLDELLTQSDVISIHIHLTDDNRHFIDKAKLNKMKDGVIIVNTSRGAIIKEDDFLAALQSGKVGGAGLDVIEGEWRDDLKDHPLIAYARDHDNVTIVPHLGGITWESQAASSQFMADKLADELRKLG